MLVYKAAQVVACTKEDPKPWTMEGRTGVTHSAKLALLSTSGDVDQVRLKAKSAEELLAKVGRFSIGKPAEVVVTEVIPVFRAGDRRACSYEYVG